MKKIFNYIVNALSFTVRLMACGIVVYLLNYEIKELKAFLLPEIFRS